MGIRCELVDADGPVEAGNMTWYCEEHGLVLAASRELLDHVWVHGIPAVGDGGAIEVRLGGAGGPAPGDTLR